MDGVVLDSEPLHENARKMMIQELGLDESREFPEAVGKSSSGFWRQVIEKFYLDGDPNDFEKRQYQYVAMQIKEKKRKHLINNRKDEENERSEQGKAGTLPPGI